jgi:hypothetical protein
MCNICNESNSSKVKLNLNNKRTKLWEIEENYHCAIIGTCLSLKEVRSLLKGLEDKDSYSDYEIHTFAVAAAEDNNHWAKRIHKFLDQKFKSAILNIKTMNKSELMKQWKISMKNGNIIRMFWAMMTHPNTDLNMKRKIYGDIHMLSHLSGASNRADLRRLQSLEKEQENHLNDLQHWKLKTSQLQAENQKLATNIKHKDDQLTAVEKINAELLNSTNEETHKQLELEIKKLKKQINHQNYEIEKYKQTNLKLIEKISQIEQKQEIVNLPISLSEQQNDNCSQCEIKDKGLCGLCVLYVGGKTNLTPHYREIIESKAGTFLYHDGGIEGNVQKLYKLLNRADMVICPVNCISHRAYWEIKKACKKQNKPCEFLNSSGVSSLANSLARVV